MTPLVACEKCEAYQKQGMSAEAIASAQMAHDVELSLALVTRMLKDLETRFAARADELLERALRTDGQGPVLSAEGWTPDSTAPTEVQGERSSTVDLRSNASAERGRPEQTMSAEQRAAPPAGVDAGAGAGGEMQAPSWFEDARRDAQDPSTPKETMQDWARKLQGLLPKYGDVPPPDVCRLTCDVQKRLGEVSSARQAKRKRKVVVAKKKKPIKKKGLEEKGEKEDKTKSLTLQALNID